MSKTNKKSKDTKVEKPSSPEYKIVASSDISKGVYSNVAVIQHTQNEFMMDFLMKIGGDGQLVSRVILSPAHIIALLDALEINIGKYESKFGKIKRDKKSEFPIN